MAASTDTRRIRVHSGHLSLDNGAVAPLGTLFNIAAAAGGQVIPGQHYFDDQIEVPADAYPATIALLTEARMLYRDPDQREWQNIRTDQVHRRLRIVDLYPRQKAAPTSEPVF